MNCNEIYSVVMKIFSTANVSSTTVTYIDNAGVLSCPYNIAQSYIIDMFGYSKYCGTAIFWLSYIFTRATFSEDTISERLIFCS